MFSTLCRRAFGLILLAVSCASGWSQGTVVLSNRNPGSFWPVYDLTVGGSLLSGADFQAQLFAGPPGSDESQLQPVGDPVPFGTNTLAGYFGFPPVERSIPGTAGGSNAVVQVRVWTKAAGSNYLSALSFAQLFPSQSHRFGKSDVVTVMLGGPTASVPLPAGRIFGPQSFAIRPLGTPSDELVVNGTFVSAAITGWSGASTNGGYVNEPFSAQGGAGQWIALGGHIYQDLPTVPGRTYLVSFAARGFDWRQTPVGSSLKVTWDDQILGDYRWNSADSRWNFLKYVVTARSDVTRLRLDGHQYPWLDDVSVKAVPSNQPVINLTIPSAARNYAERTTIPLAAVATPASNRAIAKVEFLSDILQVIATVTNAPFSATWTNAPIGSFYVSARVTDSEGTTTDSPGVLVTVSPSPKVALTFPTARQVLEHPFGGRISARVSDNSSVIARLKFYLDDVLFDVLSGGISNGIHSARSTPIALGNHSAKVVGEDQDGTEIHTTHIVFHVMEPSVPDVALTTWTATARFATNIVLAQTFTATRNGFLHHVSLPLTPNSVEEVYPIDLRVVDVSAGVPGTNVLGTSFLPGAELPLNAYQSRDFFFPSNRIAISAGRQYAMVFSTPSPFYGVSFQADMFDSYRQGMLFRSTSNGLWTGANLFGSPSTNLDIVFSTWITTNRQPTLVWRSPGTNESPIVGAPAVLRVDAADIDDEVLRVDFYQSGRLVGSATNSPFQVELTHSAAEAIELVAVGFDGFGESSRPVTNMVLFSSAPTLSSSVSAFAALQTGLFGQTVTVSNSMDVDLPGIRLWVTNLAPQAVLWNATGSSNGVSYVEHLLSVPRGASVLFKLEFYVRDRRPIATPAFFAQAILPAAPAPVGGSLLEVDRIIAKPDGVLIEFGTKTNQSYQVQYSGDSVVWKSATPPVKGTGGKVLWFDQGPPKTESHPSTNALRFYRLLQLP